MIEFVNKNLAKNPNYFYLVREFVTTFKSDEGQNDSFSHEEKFEGRDLLKCKSEAQKYYYERLEGLENGKYFLPFASPSAFEIGINSAFSITLSLIEYYNEEDYLEHFLLGEDIDTITQGQEVEQLVFKEKGLA